MQNAPFTKALKEKLFDLPKHHPKLGKVKEYEKSNSKNARNTKCQNLKPVKNDRSRLLVLNENDSTHSNFAHRLRCYNASVRRTDFSTKCTGHYCTETIRQDKCLKLNNIMNYQWFFACYYRINLIQMVSVIEFTRI